MQNLLARTEFRFYLTKFLLLVMTPLQFFCVLSKNYLKRIGRIINMISATQKKIISINPPHHDIRSLLTVTKSPVSVVQTWISMQAGSSGNIVRKLLRISFPLYQVCGYFLNFNLLYGPARSKMQFTKTMSVFTARMFASSSCDRTKWHQRSCRSASPNSPTVV